MGRALATSLTVALICLSCVALPAHAGQKRSIHVRTDLRGPGKGEVRFTIKYQKRDSKFAPYGYIPERITNFRAFDVPYRCAYTGEVRARPRATFGRVGLGPPLPKSNGAGYDQDFYEVRFYGKEEETRVKLAGVIIRSDEIVGDLDLSNFEHGECGTDYFQNPVAGSFRVKVPHPR